jgi:hypothetical protein
VTEEREDGLRPLEFGVSHSDDGALHAPVGELTQNVRFPWGGLRRPNTSRLLSRFLGT